MRYLLLIALAASLFYQCRKEGPSPQPTIPPKQITILDTLALNRMLAEENGGNIYWQASAVFMSDPRWPDVWILSADKIPTLDPGNESFGVGWIPFKMGNFTIRRFPNDFLTLPETSGVFGHTEFDAVADRYDIDSTYTNFIEVVSVDSSAMVAKGRFEAHFEASTPTYAWVPLNYHFVKGYFHVKVNK